MTDVQLSKLNKQEREYYEFMVTHEQVDVSKLAQRFSQYGARNKKCRELVGCKCKTYGRGMNPKCPAPEHFYSVVTIINGEKHSKWHYEKKLNNVPRYQAPKLPESSTMSLQEAKEKIQRLREAYLQETDELKKKIIVCQGKALKIFITKAEKDPFVQQVKEALNA